MTIEKARYRLDLARTAVANLKQARADLRKAGADNAADYVQRALKSAEGAVRHAQRLLGDATRGETRDLGASG